MLDFNIGGVEADQLLHVWTYVSTNAISLALPVLLYRGLYFIAAVHLGADAVGTDLRHSMFDQPQSRKWPSVLCLTTNRCSSATSPTTNNNHPAGECANESLSTRENGEIWLLIR